MLLSIPGIYFLINSNKPYGKAVIIYTIFIVYVIFSWWCWWYGGSFGCRAIIESYALLSLPLAEILLRLKGNFKKIILYFFVPVCIILNLFQTYQIHVGAIHYDSMTWKSYLLCFGKSVNDSRFYDALQPPDGEYAFMGLGERTGRFFANYPFLKVKEKRKINIVASNRKYVCADRSQDGKLFANRKVAKDWETFWLTRFEYDKCFLQSTDNRYVSADENLLDILISNRWNASRWELFTFIDLGKNQFLLKDSEGNFVESDSLTDQLWGATLNFSSKQIFTLENAKN